jgi:diadenosine tetraphosphatase ApaH/serine/threonine PP2A family protein phosphatase
MKLALLSDIHSNIQAFDACLAHAREHGARQFALLGDFVGYGGDPVAVVERVQELADAGAILLKGNHDELAVAPPLETKTIGDSTAAWTHDQLSASQRQFLDQLPLLTVQQQSMLLVHASADRPEQWHYVRDERSASASLDAAAAWPDVRYVFNGHVHRQSLYYRGAGADLMKFTPTAGIAIPVPKHRHWLFTIGSVGQPRDHNPQAMYALFDTDKLQLTFQRVSYDHQAAATAIRRAGLPSLFSDRLEVGR